MGTTDCKKVDSEAMKAGMKYAGEVSQEINELYDKILDAFLSGVEFQRTRYKDPDKEYYGF